MELFPEMEDIYQQVVLLTENKVNEEDLLEVIIARVEDLMQHDRGLLLSYMYRLDIQENAIEKALFEQGEEPVSHALALLILQRQKKRVETKKKYGQPPPIEGWEY